MRVQNRGQNRTREIRPSGIVEGLQETWPVGARSSTRRARLTSISTTARTVCARHDQQLGGASPLWRLMAPTTSRWQLLVVRLGGEEAGVRSRDPRNTWRVGTGRGLGGLRVEGGAVRASLHHEAKPDAIKGPFRKRGGCAMKVAGLTRGDLRGCPRMPGPVGVLVGWCGTAASERASLAVEKSAEVVLPAGSMVAGKDRTRSRGAGRSCSWDGR